MIAQDICILDVTLAPGQVLVIDSANYTVTIDGENRMDIHSGAWFDELNRDTVSISIQTAAGVSHLSAALDYTERYL